MTADSNSPLHLLLSIDPPPATPRPLTMRCLALAPLVVIALLAFDQLGSALSIPPDAGFSGNLLAQDGGIASIAAALALLVVLTAIFSIFRRSIAADAPLACAAVGLGALSARAGPMHDTLIAAQSPAVFLQLAIQLVLLYGGLVVAKAVSTLVSGRQNPSQHTKHPPVSSHVPTILVHALLTVALVAFLARSDAKSQVMASVFAAAFLASFLVASMKGEHSAIACWLGPLLAGVIGYVVCYFTAPSSLLQIGLPGGYLPALGRVLPLDYAALGTAGAIVGYWLARDLETTDEAHSALSSIAA